jgi:hypothetical protein
MLAYSANGQWEPGIGDPSVMGWVTVAAYFIGALLCGRTAWSHSRHATRSNSKGPAVFWSILAVGLVLLGVNKQLDLQTWLTLFAKRIALHEGWYSERRAVQGAFIGMVALGGAASLVGMRLLAGQLTRPVVMALAGAVFLGCFILIRASSFHHVDQMLGMDLGGLKVNWILELGSIGCIGAAAELASRRLRSRQVPGSARRAENGDY